MCVCVRPSHDFLQNTPRPNKNSYMSTVILGNCMCNMRVGDRTDLYPRGDRLSPSECKREHIYTPEGI